jgi:hypothetical protein
MLFIVNIKLLVDKTWKYKDFNHTSRILMKNHHRSGASFLSTIIILSDLNLKINMEITKNYVSFITEHITINIKDDKFGTAEWKAFTLLSNLSVKPSIRYLLNVDKSHNHYTLPTL